MGATIINVLLWPIVVPVSFVIRLIFGAGDEPQAASMQGFVTLMISIPLAITVYSALAIWAAIHFLVVE